MESELLSKIQEYHNALEAELMDLKEERQALINKVSYGERLSARDNQRNKELSNLINKVEAKLATFKDLEMYEKLENLFNSLTKKISVDEKQEIKSEIITIYKNLNEELIDEIVFVTGLDKNCFSDLKSFEQELKSEIDGLKMSIDIINKRNKGTKELENELKEKEDLLKNIENHLNHYVDENILKDDLNRISRTKTTMTEKRAIINKYTSKFTDLIEENKTKIISYIDNNQELVVESNLKEETENTLATTNVELEKTLKLRLLINSIFITAIIVTTIIVTKGCKFKRNTQTNDENLDSKITSEDFIEDNKQTIDDGFVNVIDVYANVSDFNANYLNDYEFYRAKYNLTPSKAVDYVNRAYMIQANNFYEDAQIDDIIDVIMAIDNKNLFTADNASLAQSINTTFNQVVDNYLFGTNTLEDINKINAIKYFANKDSDLGRFLDGFSSLTQDIINNPEDVKAKDNMISYINIFATSVNGFTNDETALTDNKEFNENAKVNDYFDWYMAYNSFVGPLGSVLTFPRDIQSIDLFYAEQIYHNTALLENASEESLKTNREKLLVTYGYGEHLDSIFKLYKIYE